MTISDSLMADYVALTADCGFVELTDWSTITVTGEDRLTFLHNMCTNDIKQLTAGEGCEAFCTDVKGKIVAHIFVLALEDRLELLTVPGQAKPLMQHLDRYIIREDVQLEDRTLDKSWYLLAGPESQSKVANMCEGQTADLAIAWQHKSYSIDGVEHLIARCELLWSAGYLLSCSNPESIATRLEGAAVRACTSAAWDILRIESGVPLFEVDFTTANLPQEIDRDELAISFNKGCYLGQETIARIDALGHVNQKLVLVELDGQAVPTVGMELCVADKCVGKVTSSAYSPQTQSPLAIASLRRGSNEVGTQLTNEVGIAKVIARVEAPENPPD